MLPPMIDREEPLELFRQMLDTDAPHRVLRLLGEAKMGKTLLLTDVFPKLAAQQQVRHALFDMRNTSLIGIPLLNQLCQKLRPARFVNFDKAHKAWLDKPQIEVKGFQAILSIISARSRPEDDSGRILPHLTRCIVEDLSKLNDKPLILIFDHVDDPSVQSWLMDDLLDHLYTLEHLRFVLGGRSLPDAAGSYAANCCSYELRPVEEHEPYMRYCQAIGADLHEQAILPLAKVLKFAPGLFADTVNTNFLPKQGVRHV